MTPERYEQIGRIFHAALERDPAERASFLAEACGGDEVLNREVASLIASHEKAWDFLEKPPDDVAAGWQAAAGSLPQGTFSHYRMLLLLGKGGMGEVWLAEDTQLGRRVAVKLLPAEFTTDPRRVRRFAQEARAASALNHPNIITIYEIGEFEERHYIATEYVEGETLRQRMVGATEKRVELSEAVGVAVQIAAALSAAHEAGIVHRDIKPENVMVRRDGYVKVLDFGLAKLTEAPAPAVDSQAPTLAGFSTESGVVMGTPRYMSPEQARGEKADARTDIFSLGVMLYEMIAGRAPFAGETASEMIAAILRDEPPPLTSHAPDAPQELERIVGRALRKNREERYQKADDLLADLKKLQRDLELEATRYGKGERPLTPNNGALRAEQVALTPSTARFGRRLIAIIALVGLVISATVAWFYLKRPPVLTSKDTILLADFENETGEEIFDKILKQGLAIQLQQSPFLNLFPEAQMRHELKLMKRQPNEHVTAEMAGEICERQNLKALIAGSIAPLGSHYVITLEAINGQSGETLAREQVEAENKEQVLRALSQAATRLREGLGESLSSIQRFDRPLQEGTTAKPEAFKAYSQAVELAVRGQVMESIPFYQHAVEIDPEFAIAYCQLAIMYWVTERPELAAEQAKKSYELKDRAGEIEKFRITHMYHRLVTGDLNKAIEVLRLQRRTYPREYTGAHDLGSAYNQLGQYDQSVEEFRESIRLNPNFAAPYRRLADAFLCLDRYVESKNVLAQAFHQGLDNRSFHLILYQLAFINSDTTAMQQQLDWARGKPEEYVAFDWQTGAMAFAGQWRKARELSRQTINLTAQGDTKEVAARYVTDQALRGAVLGECRLVRADAAQGLKLARGRASLPRAALALGLCGEAIQAKMLIDDLTMLYPEDTIINSIWLPTIRAAMDLQRGDAAAAMERLQQSLRYEAAAEFWPQYLRGQAYLKLGRGAEAAVEFQKILDHRGQGPLSVLYPLAYSGLARASALVGNMAKSQKAWGDFFAVWKDADPDLAPMMEAKREYEKK